MPKNNNILNIKKLTVSIEDKSILKNIDLLLQEGHIHALMGPNGSGKSTLSQVLMGHPSYKVDDGTVKFLDKDLLDLDPSERAKAGLFLSFQYPSEIPGVSVSNYLRMIYNKKTGEKLSPIKFRSYIQQKLDLLEMSYDFLGRYLNDGFSGGEKKKMEILQLLVLEPKLAILDEIDSGLDVDAIQIISKALNWLKKENNMTLLVITHYTRILKYLEPDEVFVMINGAIVQQGGKELAHQLEEKGYAPFGE